jgi:glycosyltransferase involved in cell wall biosynthesis
MAEQGEHRLRFTTIMPVYNHVDYVEEAVRSVREQIFTDWQLIIVDDGSTDGSAELLDKLAAQDERIEVIHQSNAGPAAARNAALPVARGQWLTYLDSDDVWLPDALDAYDRFLQDHPDVQFVYGYRHRLNEDGTVTESAGEFQDAPTGTKELFGRMYLSHLCVCYRRELMDEVGGYDGNLRSCEDYELYLRMSLHTDFHPLGRATGLRRRHGTNISRQTGYSRRLEAEVLRRFVQEQGGGEKLRDEAIARRLGRLYYAAGRQYFKARCFDQGLESLREAHRYRRTVKSTLIAGLCRLLRPVGTHDGRSLPDL